MSCKVIPQSLRLDKKQNWNSNWIADKNEYSKLFYFEHTLEEYVQKYGKRNGFSVTNVSLLKEETCINIFLNAYIITKKNEKNPIDIKFTSEISNLIKIYLKELNLNYTFKVHLINYNMYFPLVKKFFASKKKKYPFLIFRFLGVSHVGILTKNINLITSFLAENLKKNPRHKKYLINMHKILKKRYKTFKNCIGYKIQFKGRINGKARKKKFTLKAGNTPLNTLKYDIKYDLKEVITPYGICSLKLWVFYKY